MTHDENTTPEHTNLPGRVSGLQSRTLDLTVRNLRDCHKSFDSEVTGDEMLNELWEQTAGDKDGQQTLMLQTQVLNALFGRFVDKSLKFGLSGDYAALALQAQKQCRHAYEALSALRRSEDAKNAREQAMVRNELKDREK